MNTWDAVYEELRKIRKELEGERQRRRQTLLTGTVERVEGARVKVRIADEDEDGKPIVTPWLRMSGHTGKRGAGVAKFTKLGVGEAVMVISPSGELGTMSAVTPWIDTEDDPAPGAAETDGDVVEIGDARIEVKDGYIRAAVGGNFVEISSWGIRLVADRVGAIGSHLTHNAHDVGWTHTHTQVEPGGGLSGPPP